MRVGVDVGGVNTDAACVCGGVVLATAKSPTTPNGTDGLNSAVRGILDASGAGRPTSPRS